MRCKIADIFLLCLIVILFSGCSYNPFISNNQTTGSPVAAAVGAGAGALGVHLLGGSKTLTVLGGITGGMIGYYSTTLTYDAAGVVRGGGQVYKVGDFVGIYIPSDLLFEPTTSDFLPQATPILESAAAVLRRYPNNNIVISGNTSGFYRPGYEQRLSERRARKVAAFLWDQGINNFRGTDTETRSLTYIGYGDYFPISQKYTNDGIRENSRIQITSYPTNCDLHLEGGAKIFNNIGMMKDSGNNEKTVSRCYVDADGRRECFDPNEP